MAREGLCPPLVGLLLLAAGAWAQEPARIAVIDFQVQSANPQFAFLGKGFAEFIAIDLSRNRRVTLIEREKRNQVLQEQEFSASDLADQTKQVKVGRLLAAAYLVAGSIYDIGGKLTLTVQLLNAETGAVAYTDRISGEASAYDQLSAAVAKGVLGALKLETPRELASRVEAPQARPQEAAVSFSQAVDAYDRKDVAQARRSLDRACKLDPGNEAVRSYLAKLAVSTAKFKTIVEQYYPTRNPAYLGIIQKDQAYALVGAANLLEEWRELDDYPDYRIQEQDSRATAGYQRPVGAALGIGVNYFGFHRKSSMEDFVTLPYRGENMVNRFGHGAAVSLGYAPAVPVAVGLA